MTSKGFKVIKRIGGGSEGTTHLVEAYATKRKMIRKTATSYDIDGEFPREVRIMREILGRHDRILHLIDFKFELDKYTGKKNLLMLYEYYKGGDLEQFQRGSFSETFLWHVFTQVAEGLAYLHFGHVQGAPVGPRPNWKRIIHRDLKPDNIFLKEKCDSRNPFPDVVIGDFGLATFSPLSGPCGAIAFRPPESVSTAASDVWSLGATIHLMAHGRTPIADMPSGWPYGLREQGNKSLQAKAPQPLPYSYSDALNRNMMRCFERDIDERISSLALFTTLRKEGPRY
ncbi:hypothetical protein ACLMJK_003797 [Lecanora helva]